MSSHRYKVTGAYVDRVAAMTDMSLRESVFRFQQALRRIGVDRALRTAGIREGDFVTVGPHELEWSGGPIVKPPKLSKKKHHS